MLSVLYVIRNEQDCIEKSIQSIQPIADEIVIIDSGSFDKTISICRKFPYVRIFSHAWVHDYSKTKNYGIKQCKGDWILSMDADEMLDPTSASVIKTAVNNAKPNIAGFAVNFADHEASFDINSPANEITFFPSIQTRAFRKHKQIMFEGRVAETISPSVKTVGGIDLLPATIHHYLWHGKGESFKDGRLAYYKKLGANLHPEIPKALPEEKSIIAEQTAIVIIAHNVLSATKECVGSISRHTTSPYNIYFVDNGSTDGTYEYMRGSVGRNPAKFQNNVGVAKAKNAGARDVLSNPNAKYICFLDNDTKVTSKWLDEMISILERNPKIGLIGPISNNANGPQSLYNNDDSKIPMEQREPEFLKVNSVDGFCMVMPIYVARGVGLFDESLGQYGCEDKDLCERVKQAGYDIAIANRSFVEHRGRLTLIENHIDWQRLATASNIKYSQKWLKPAVVVPSSPPSPKNFVKKPRVSIVLITHNRLDMTSACIESLLSTTTDFELILVDNGSTDGTVDWVKKTIPFAKVTKNDKNLGVPIARNQGIRQTTTEHIVIMDNDVVLKTGWLEELMEMITKGADAVGLEAWQIDHNFTACYKCHNTNDRFDYLGGACNLFRREIFETAGLLDEGFSPAYYEDVDICIRAKNNGFKLAWKQTSKIVHREHSTLINGQKEFKYQEALQNSHTRFAKKMRGEIKVTPEILPKISKKLNILYLGMQYDYGDRNRGESFEHANFYPALKEWNQTGTFNHFDFVDLGKQHGIKQMSEMLWKTVGSIEPDVMFSVFFDENHDPLKSTIKDISTTTKTKTIGWFCDSHFRYDNFDKPWAYNLNHCVTTSATAYQRYVQDGFGEKIIKSQWGAAPLYKKLNLTRDIDVSFIGQPHGDRRQVIEKLNKAGLNIQCFGTGWPQRLSFNGMIDIWNRSKVNLNLNNACDTRFKQIKGRNFEVPACGGFLLTGHPENLEEYYEIGKEVVTFNNTDEIIEKTKYYLAHDAEREAIANAGYERTMKDHTYSTRFNEIFSKAGLLRG